MATDEEIEAAADAIAIMANDDYVRAGYTHTHREFAEVALEAAERVRPKHTDRYTPCPTCGFVVVKTQASPFVYRDDDA